MSIGNIQSKSIDYKKLSAPDQETTVTPYTRPTGWLTLPTLLTTDYKFVGLYAIFENANYVAFRVNNSSGSYYVDWGDGTNNTYATGVTASHEYDYSTYDVSNTTLITRNNLTYKQAIITVTPVTVNNVTSMYLHNPHPSNPQTTYATNWLDISVNMPTMNAFNVTGGDTAIKPWLLEQATIGVIANNQSNGYMFYGCSALKNVIIDTSAAFINCSSMFYGCSALQTIPSFNTAWCTSMSYMFYNCYSLVSLPSTFNTSSNNNSSLMFNNCYSLDSPPPMKVGSNGQAMFQGCKSLKRVILDTTGTYNANSMFSGCSNLEESPILATPSIGLTSGMFSGCSKLKKVNLFTTTNVTDMSNMFSGCSSLTSIPSFKTNAVTTMASMFYNCVALTSVPSFTSSVCNNTSYMFYNCPALTSVPSFNTPANTNTSYMFYNCLSLTSVPSFTTTNVSNMSNMFNNCAALTSAPSFNTGNVLDMSYMFNGCTALTSVPSFNTGNVLNMTSMFNSCFSLAAIPTFNTVACTNMSSMFQGSGIVTVPALVTTACPIGGFTTVAASAYNLQKCNMIIRGGTSFLNTRLNKTQLESIFANVAKISPTQLMTITVATGATAGPTLSCTGAASTTVLTTSATSTLQVGMYISTPTTRTVTFTTGTNTVTTTTAHGFSDGDKIFFTSVNTTTSIITFTLYYVINSTSTNFQVSLTSGGPLVTVNSSGTGVVRWATKVVSFVANTSITLDRPISTIPMSATSVSFRFLNTFEALARNYTIVG
jgi:surface protein